MDLGLNGRVTLVVASSRGLGRAIANGLATEGAMVMISTRDEAALAQTTWEIREATGAEVDYHATDLTRVDDLWALVKQTVERFGGLHVLVSNAGGPLAGSFDTVSDEDWRGAFELNLMSVVKLVREALPHARTKVSGGSSTSPRPPSSSPSRTSSSPTRCGAAWSGWRRASPSS